MKRKVTAAGWLDDRISGTRRSAKREPCPRCGALVWRGDDDDRCAHVARVDVVAVGRLDEVVALLAGRASYNLITRGGVAQLQHRDIERVRNPAPSAIHLSHECERKENR